MGLRYDLKKSKHLENVLFIAVIRIFFEFFDMQIRYGKFSFSFAFSSWTVFFTLVLITVACGAVLENETASAVSVGGIAFMYYYFVILRLLNSLAEKDTTYIYDAIMALIIAVAASVLLAFMFGKIRIKTAKISAVISIICATVYSVRNIIIFSSQSRFCFSSVKEILVPLILFLFVISSEERK